MAPILSTAVGVAPQMIDDPSLLRLLRKLNEFEPKELFGQKKNESEEEVIAPLDIAKLVSVIDRYQSWVFEEQVRLISLDSACIIVLVFGSKSLSTIWFALLLGGPERMDSCFERN